MTTDVSGLGWKIKLKHYVLKIIVLVERHPWLMAIIGFGSGLFSYFMVQRKQEVAQIIVILMLVSWAWLALENLLQRGVSHWFGFKLPPAVLSFVTQMVQQESLFFVIPFFIASTVWNSAQSAFTSLLIIAAFISIVDPIYYHWLAPRRWLYFIFHGFTLFAVLLTTLPIILSIPTPQTYMWALGIALVLSLPNILRAMPVGWLQRIAIGILLISVVSGVGILVRPWIPPAPLRLTQVAITNHIDESRSPKTKLKQVTLEQLHDGLYAYTAIKAPRGLNEKIYHVWLLNGKQVDKVALDIAGGREAGYRAWSHKLNFPEDSLGRWQIKVVTEANQIIGVLRFRVVKSLPQDSPAEDLKNTQFQDAEIKNVESENVESENAESKNAETRDRETPTAK
ncbi:MAG: DUF5924 family protein [Pseudomonadota bacterium]